MAALGADPELVGLPQEYHHGSSCTLGCSDKALLVVTVELLIQQGGCSTGQWVDPRVLNLTVQDKVGFLGPAEK